jgi:type IV secretory pathway VirB10-like protein
MSQKKWAFAFTLAALMIFLSLIAAGCGGSTSEAPQPTETEPIEAAPEVEDSTKSEPTQPAPTAEESTAIEPTEPAPTAEESTSAEAALDGKLLLESRCTQCHDLGRVTSASKTAEEWEKYVVRMVGKGAKLNAEEQVVLIEYLATTYP